MQAVYTQLPHLCLLFIPESFLLGVNARLWYLSERNSRHGNISTHSRAIWKLQKTQREDERDSYMGKKMPFCFTGFDFVSRTLLRSKVALLRVCISYADEGLHLPSDRHLS